MIFYSGIGSKPNGIHTEDEFLEIMKKHFAYKEWRHELEHCNAEDHYQLGKFKGYILPDDFIFFSLEDWLDYSGAEKKV